jgi:hypothetical protein
MFRAILCPVDFDDNSIAAVDLVCKLAAQSVAEQAVRESTCPVLVVPPRP